MKMNEKQAWAYNLGKSLSDKCWSVREAYGFLGADLEEIAFNWNLDQFFQAGFEGDEPEYVEAVRYGDIPAEGRSTNYADNSWEKGLSVIRIIRKPEDADKFSLYDVTMGGQGFKKITVAGWYLGKRGSDGEPLLVDAVRI